MPSLLTRGRLTYGQPWGKFYLGGTPYQEGAAGVTQVYPDSILVDIIVEGGSALAGSDVYPDSILVDVIVEDPEVTVLSGNVYPTSALVDIIVGRPTVLGGVTTGQWSSGTVDLTNGSATVVGIATSWSGNVVAGNYLVILDPDVPAASVAWRITAVGGDESLTIAAPWPGATTGGLPYVIHRKINSRGLPLIRRGDQGLPQLWNRAMLIIDNSIRGV